MESTTQPTSWRSKPKIHPAADLFPMMSPEELRALGEDIKANGLKHPITIWCPKDTHSRCDASGRYFLDEQGILIDGRNRLDAMELAGIPIYTPYYKESWIKGLKRTEGETEETKQQTIARVKEAGPMEGESQDDFLARIKEEEEDEDWEGETEEEFQERIEHYRSRMDLGISHRHVFETGLPQNKKIPKSWTIVNDPYAYVISANINRRHLTTEQRKAIAAEILKRQPDKSDRSVAKETGLDEKTVTKVRKSNPDIPDKAARVEASGRKARGRKPGSAEKPTDLPILEWVNLPNGGKALVSPPLEPGCCTFHDTGGTLELSCGPCNMGGRRQDASLDPANASAQPLPEPLAGMVEEGPRLYGLPFASGAGASTDASDLGGIKYVLSHWWAGASEADRLALGQWFDDLRMQPQEQDISDPTEADAAE